MLSQEERHLRARAAAFALHAQGGTSTSAATAAFMSRFERQVDPGGTLPADERARRAAFARKSYMAKLALRAARIRRLGAPSDREVARIAELEDLLEAVEGRDSSARAGIDPAAPTSAPNVVMNKMDPAAVAMPAGSAPEVRRERADPAR